MVTDLPSSQGGKNEGTTALELALMSLAGCITTIYKIVAENSKFAFKQITVDLEAEKPKDKATIAWVTGGVEVQTDEEEQKAESVFRVTMKRCPVGVLFENANVDMNLTFKVKK